MYVSIHLSIHPSIREISVSSRNMKGKLTEQLASSGFRSLARLSCRWFGVSLWVTDSVIGDIKKGS